MTDDKKPARKKNNRRAAAKAFYKDGLPLKDALIAGNYSATQARKGRGLLAERKSLALAFSKAHDRAVRKMAALGSAYEPSMRADLVRGRLIDLALADGSPSASVRSCELLGKDKQVNMFTPDTSISLFSMQIPTDWESRYVTTPTIDAIEVKDAVAQESLESLPKQDGMITLSSFSPCQLKSGKVEVPTTMPVEPEPMPVAVPAESIDQQYEIEVLTQRRKGQQ